VSDPTVSSAPVEGRHLVVTPASDIEPEATRWLWKGRIPLGSVTLLAGRAGLGKSTLSCELAAQLTRGELDGDLQGQPCDVLLVSYEDAAASTIVPRLAAAGADLRRVRLVEAQGEDGHPDLVSLPGDVDALAAVARQCDARFLIVDPLVAALPSKINSHRDQDVRRALAPLAQLAESADLAVLGAIHFNKAQGTDTLGRISGSGGFGNLARSVLAFGADPSDTEGEDGPRRVLAHTKSNVSRKARSLAYHLEPASVPGRDGASVEVARLVLDGECDVVGSDLLEVSDADARSETDEAAEWLEGQLADGEWHRSADLKGPAKAAGLAWRTVQRARRGAGAEVRQEGFPRRTEWRFPPVAPTPADATVATELGATAQTRIPEQNEQVAALQSRQGSIPGATAEDTARNGAVCVCSRPARSPRGDGPDVCATCKRPMTAFDGPGVPR